MYRLFKWWCCRYMLRVFCIDRSWGDSNSCIFHKCRDASYKPERPGMLCEKEECVNPRRKNGTPKTIPVYYG